MQPYKILNFEKAYDTKLRKLFFQLPRNNSKWYKQKTIILAIMQGILNAHTMDTIIKTKEIDITSCELIWLDSCY